MKRMTNTKTITILQINDTHGYLEEHWEHFWDGGFARYAKVGGYPRMKTYIDSVRADKKANFLLLDGGDTFHGTYPVVESKGQILPPLLNELGIDAMTAHWEFAYGPKAFHQLVDALTYPMLAINCYDKETNKLAFDPYLIKEVGGLKVAIIGIASNIIDKTMPAHFSEGLYFTLGKEELPKYIEQVKNEEAADLVILLSHLGYPQELKLAKEVNGIDVLLSAHTHNRTYEPIMMNQTLIFQSGCHGSFIGHLDLTIQGKKIVDYSHKLVTLDEKIPEDETMKSTIDQLMEPHREQLNKVLGKTNTDLNRNTVLESTMDNFLLKSMLDYTGAQLAFSNGWRYGAPIPKGDITVNDLWNIIPVNPPLSRTKITGQEIWDMMEENLERTFATDPYDQMGGYVKRVMGMNLYFKIENPFGERIQQLFIQGQPIDKEKVYDAVYVTNQGVPKKYGHDKVNLDIQAVDALKEYLKRHGTVDANLQDSIVAV
jgi:2',3'-cyclic-nucleotide 2'-phosphodiesterase (5'-nucleotidase family)